jgi:ABC-type polysaccharide/polyol phosphate transport system ATPase subunit
MYFEKPGLFTKIQNCQIEWTLHGSESISENFYRLSISMDIVLDTRNNTCFRLRTYKMEQRKLNDQANTLVDFAKVRKKLYARGKVISDAIARL